MYHSEEILAQMLSHPGHSFTNLVILHEPGLLSRLSKLVTTAPTVGVMETATGIPPYVEMECQMRDMMNSIVSLTNMQREQTATLVDTIKQAIDKNSMI